MSFTKNILSSELLSSFGWTIIHSIWIGGIVFLLAWILLYLFRNGKVNHRYSIAVGSLFVFLILVTVAFFKVYTLQNINYGLNLTIGDNFRNLSNSFIETGNLTKLTNNFSLASIENYINQNIPILVVIWLVGLLFFSLRFAGGLIYTYRMRSRSQKIGSEELNTILHQISKKIGLKSKVQIKETSLISTPMVIGFIKPIILLPLGMANGLSLHQAEAILFHEIAHIYRFDYLVNLIQSIVEVILFYHPVVWWLSAHIRAERENICDDIAIKHTGSALDYAKALTNLQDSNKQTPDIVLAFSNKKYRFMNRIRRLLGLPLIENNLIEGLISSFLLIVSIVLFTTHAGPVFAQADGVASVTIELPLQNDQDQESQKIKEYEQILKISLKKSSIEIGLEKKKLLELKNQNQLDQKTYEFRTKLLDLEVALINDSKRINASEHNIKLKKDKITKVEKRYLEKRYLEKRYLEKRHKLLVIKKEAQSSQIKQKELQKKIAQKQKMTKEQQKKMQYELQKMEEFQKEVASFSEKAGQELKMKQDELNKVQLKMEKREPTAKEKKKLNAMKVELKKQEAKFSKIKEANRQKVKELEKRMKDKMADLNEVEKTLEAEITAEEEKELEREIEEIVETEQVMEVEMAEEIEMAIEPKVEKERSDSSKIDGVKALELTKQDPGFSCNSARFDEVKNTVELVGNVIFKTDILEFKSAKKVLWNRDTNEIIVSGLEELTFDGKIQFSEKKDKKTLRYTIGERIAYVE